MVEISCRHYLLIKIDSLFGTMYNIHKGSIELDRRREVDTMQCLLSSMSVDKLTIRSGNQFHTERTSIAKITESL